MTAPVRDPLNEKWVWEFEATSKDGHCWSCTYRVIAPTLENAAPLARRLYETDTQLSACRKSFAITRVARLFAIDAAWSLPVVRIKRPTVEDVANRELEEFLAQ